MTRRYFSPFTSLFTACLLTLTLAFTASATQGVNATPEADDDLTGAFPVHIHSGTCADLGGVVFPLNDLTRVGAGAHLEATPIEGIATPPEIADATPAASPSTDGTVPIASSSTIVDASLDDILAEEHAINVHESPESIQNYVACGDLTGEATDGELHIGLDELNGSGFSGDADLVDNGDGTTTVTVYLVQGTTGTPEATPAT
jgi:hypothetical protein